MLREYYYGLGEIGGWLLDHGECALRVTVSPLAAKAKTFLSPN